MTTSLLTPRTTSAARRRLRDLESKKEALQDELLRLRPLASLGTLSAKLAHEINNALGIVFAKARLRELDEGLPPKVTRDLRLIREQSDRIALLVRAMLAGGRPPTAPMGPTAVAAVVERSLALVGHRAKRYGVVIESCIPPFLPAVLVPARELEQVFLNIGLNAVDAMRDLGGTLTVSATSHSVAPCPTIEIAFADSGPGIDPHIQDRLFEPFATTKANRAGTGLGLAICRDIMIERGGTIDVESSAEGSTFRVLLPRA